LVIGLGIAATLGLATVVMSRRRRASAARGSAGE
jgi:hypothetical protein